jgi:hypothetical protein
MAGPSNESANRAMLKTTVLADFLVVLESSSKVAGIMAQRLELLKS